MMPGPMRVDRVGVDEPRGGNQFWLEMESGRFHGPTAGAMTPHRARSVAGQRATNRRRLEVNDCDVYPPEALDAR